MNGMICGIDPGLDGAISFYEPTLGLLETKPLPVRWKFITGKKGQVKRFEIDKSALYAMLNMMSVSKIICEEPQAMPGGGPVQNHSFGVTCGSVYGVIEAYQYNKQKEGITLPILYVFPANWKVYMKVPSDKNRARDMAVKLFPAYADQFKLKQDEGKAEAALLAWYAANVKDIQQKERTPYVKGQRTQRDNKAKKPHRDSKANPKNR